MQHAHRKTQVKVKMEKKWQPVLTGLTDEKQESVVCNVIYIPQTFAEALKPALLWFYLATSTTKLLKTRLKIFLPDNIL